MLHSSLEIEMFPSSLEIGMLRNLLELGVLRSSLEIRSVKSSLASHLIARNGTAVPCTHSCAHALETSCTLPCQRKHKIVSLCAICYG